MFIGRTQEISRLTKEFSFARPSLLVVYGRRRIGKSVLLREAARDRPRVLYQATRVTPALNLDGFKAEIARSLGADPLLNGLGDWLSVLTYLARKAEDMPGLVGTSGNPTLRQHPGGDRGRLHQARRNRRSCPGHQGFRFAQSLYEAA